MLDIPLLGENPYCWQFGYTFVR